MLFRSVARFIGAPPMNTITGTVTEDAGETFLATPGGRIAVPGALGAAVRSASAGEVVLGVRPEHLDLDPTGQIEARVTVIESLGHERHVVCRLDDDQMVIVRQASDEARAVEGESVRLRAQPEGIHLFDAATGIRLEPTA